jgi:hypothetical protein
LRADVVSAISVCDGLVNEMVVAPARVSFAGGIPTQLPIEQLVPAMHARPHIPQFAALVRRSTQVPPQFVCPAGHAHEPAMQL